MSGADGEASTSRVSRAAVRQLALACGALGAAWLVYAFAIVRDFSGPFIAAGDANYFDYLSYHVQHHFQWGLPPKLDFFTNEVGYPDGTSIVYLSWCIERDLLLAGLRSLFGPGPWIQLYCAASPGVGAFGTLLLLKREVGVRRATLVAFAGSFMAFYAAYKFPIHLNMAVLHWATLSIVVDWLIARYVTAGRRLTGRLFFVRIVLLFMVLGLDLPYVAGYALTSFTVMFCYCIAFIFYTRRRGGPSLRELLPINIRSEVRERRRTFAILGVMFLLGALVYFPGTLLILKASRVYHFPDAGGTNWASQFKLLVPFFPGANPSSPWVHSLFGEEDGVAEFSTGWALVLVAAAGVWSARKEKKLSGLVPVLITFALCFSFHPGRFPTLHLFPWFAFNRVAGRSTIFFPLFFALLGLGYKHGPRAGSFERTVGALAVVETLTAYFVARDYQPARFDAPLASYMRTIHDAPGEAILDWPFCIAGANGTGTDKLCPYYRFLSTSYSNRRFHDKKVVGFYLSRLHESQITPRLALANFFSPDDPDPHRATHETRCFDDAQWTHFADLYRSHDFAGIQLYLDFLPPTCVAEFHARFGSPVAHARLPGAGAVEFIPRTSAHQR